MIDAVVQSDIILCHPEALFGEKGPKLLTTLKGQVSTVVIDECHKVEEWYLFTQYSVEIGFFCLFREVVH